MLNSADLNRDMFREHTATLALILDLPEKAVKIIAMLLEYSDLVFTMLNVMIITHCSINLQFHIGRGQTIRQLQQLEIYLRK